MGTLEEAVWAFVRRRCTEIGVDPSTVNSTFNLWEGGMLDSVSIVDLIIVIERATHTTIDMEDSEIETFYSIEAITRAFGRVPVPAQSDVSS
jgi:acyl carrier protein